MEIAAKTHSITAAAMVEDSFITGNRACFKSIGQVYEVINDQAVAGKLIGGGKATPTANSRRMLPKSRNPGYPKW